MTGRDSEHYSDRVGAFRTDCTVVNHVDRSRSVRIAKLLVDTGSEYSWIPKGGLESIGVVPEKTALQFVMANRALTTRSVGFAILRVPEGFTIDEVVFAEPGDLSLLGARTLEGMNLSVDPSGKKLVASGPLPAAASP